MKVDGMCALSDFVGDFIAYRNLRPADPRLPGLDDLREALGLQTAFAPRKHEPDYARVVVEILKRARALDSKSEIRRVLFVGDTRLLDSTAFANICAASGWAGVAFIGAENGDPAAAKVEPLPGGGALYLSNRWASLDAEFRHFLAAQNFSIDAQTAVLIDMDKTALGARGRNAATIDNARVAAVEETVAALLGDRYDAAAFRALYDEVIHPDFHDFTEDNQDNVAYLCLMVGSGLITRDQLVPMIFSGTLRRFDQFAEYVDSRQSTLPPALRAIHAEIFANMQAGDPTPFKPFRYTEFRLTSARLGCLPDEAPLEQFLSEEILLTREVRDFALECKSRGALVFALSDKPDEASIPTPELAAHGFAPLHRKKTHVLGAG